MSDQVNDSLTKICHKLSNGTWFGKGAYNYVVDVKVFCQKVSSEQSETILIEEIIPNAVVDGIEKSNLQELLNTISEYFEFKGDEGSYPNQKYLDSEDFKGDLNQLLKQIENVFSKNLGISKFWLKDGHPLYPVFWDYAFLIKKTDKNFIIVGSSSD